jgi:hypothetical protein
MEPQCAAPRCRAESLIRVSGMPLCLRHYDQLQRRLAREGTTLDESPANAADLVNRAHAGFSLARVLADESDILRTLSERARERLHAITQIQDLRRRLQFARAQWSVLSRDGPAHRKPNLVRTLQTLNDQIQELESQLQVLRRVLRRT